MKHLKIFENFAQYKRVLPRDLFNESKLLKCIGRLCLLIHNDNNMPINIRFEHDGDPFKIQMLKDGSLTITNIEFLVNNISCIFKTTYNNKSNYPLFMEYDNVEYLVFDENGEFEDEFIEICNNISEVE